MRDSVRSALTRVHRISVLSLLTAACAAPAPEPLATRDEPIIGGSLDTTHRGVVSLLKRVQGGYLPSCSGTLLTQNLVLTARHCVASLDSPDGASVQCGSTEFEETTAASSLVVSIEANVGEEGKTPYPVADVWVPSGSDAVCGRDIALLLLEGAGVPAGMAAPIEPGFSEEVEPDSTFAAIGYGLQDPNDQRGETAGHRMGVDDATVFCAGLACQTELVTADEWIADSPVCSGDSGGPALNPAGRVVGVTSRGDADCTVGIYTSVFAWRQFIIDGVFDAAEAGHYAPPSWAGEPPPGFDPGTGGTGGTSSSGGATSAGGTRESGGMSGSSGGAISIAGASSGSSGASGTMSPVADPLGSSCSGSCPGNYLCWAETKTSGGICVPACSAMSSACPADYACSAVVSACVPQRVVDGTSANKDDDGCSVAAPGYGSNPVATWLWLGVAAFVAGTRPRRRARS